MGRQLRGMAARSYETAWHGRFDASIAMDELRFRWDYTDVHPAIPIAGVALDNIVMQSVVLMATPILTWTNPANITYGTPLGTHELNASGERARNACLHPGQWLRPDIWKSQSDRRLQPHRHDSLPQCNRERLHSRAACSANCHRFRRNPGFWPKQPCLQRHIDRRDKWGHNITATATCSATPASTVGPYAIIPSLTYSASRQTNYQVTLVNGTLVVSAASVALSWTNPSSIAYGTPLGSQQLNASAGIPGTFMYNPTNGSVLARRGQTLSLYCSPQLTPWTTATPVRAWF